MRRSNAAWLLGMLLCAAVVLGLAPLNRAFAASEPEGGTEVAASTQNDLDATSTIEFVEGGGGQNLTAIARSQGTPNRLPSRSTSSI